jgi:GNAT superfamily N-acetyltransferase
VRSEPALAEFGIGQFLASLDALTGLYAAAMAPPPVQLPGRRAIMERHAGYSGFRVVVAVLPPVTAAPDGELRPSAGGRPHSGAGLPRVRRAGGDAAPGGGPGRAGGMGPVGGAGLGGGASLAGWAGPGGAAGTGGWPPAGERFSGGGPYRGAGSVPLVGFAYGFHGEAGQWWHDLVHDALTERQGRRAARAWMNDSFEVAEVHVHPAYQGRGTGHAMLERLVTGRAEHTAVLSTMDADTSAHRLYRGMGFADLIPGFLFPGAGLPYTIMGATLPLPALSARRGYRWRGPPRQAPRSPNLPSPAAQEEQHGQDRLRRPDRSGVQGGP